MTCTTEQAVKAIARISADKPEGFASAAGAYATAAWNDAVCTGSDPYKAQLVAIGRFADARIEQDWDREETIYIVPGYGYVVDQNGSFTVAL